MSSELHYVVLSPALISPNKDVLREDFVVIIITFVPVMFGSFETSGNQLTFPSIREMLWNLTLLSIR